MARPGVEPEPLRRGAPVERKRGRTLSDGHRYEGRRWNDTIFTEKVADSGHDLTLVFELRVTHDSLFGAERQIERIEL